MTYKILALDGGGFRGVLSATILKAVEQTIREEFGEKKGLNDYFDLVAGTSTGSILAAGITMGMKAEELLNLYKQHGKRIFPRRIREMRKLIRVTRGVLPILLYAHEAIWPWKEEGLAVVLKEQLKPRESAKLKSTFVKGSPVTISDIERPVLLIPAYNTIKRQVDWFVSNNPSDRKMWYDEIEIWKLCVCSASAPTFFPPYNLENPQDEKKKTYTYIDGGIAVNNPALIAIAHALFLPYNYEKTDLAEEHSIELSDISILSIGSGRATENFSYKEVKSWGLAKWAMHISDLFIPAPNDVTDSVCRQLIRGNQPENANRCLRLDLDLDRLEDKKLKEIDNPEFYDEFEKIASDYLESKEKNIRIDDKKLNPLEAIKNFIRYNKDLDSQPAD